jgi:hypothetical protein
LKSCAGVSPAARARNHSRVMVGSRDGAIEKFHNSAREFPIRVRDLFPYSENFISPQSRSSLSRCCFILRLFPCLFQRERGGGCEGGASDGRPPIWRCPPRSAFQSGRARSTRALTASATSGHLLSKCCAVRLTNLLTLRAPISCPARLACFICIRK